MRNSLCLLETKRAASTPPFAIMQAEPMLFLFCFRFCGGLFRCRLLGSGFLCCGFLHSGLVFCSAGHTISLLVGIYVQKYQRKEYLSNDNFKYASMPTEYVEITRIRVK